MLLVQWSSSVLWTVLLILPHSEMEPLSQLHGPLVLSSLESHRVAAF